jgi:hypothetical protein
VSEPFLNEPCTWQVSRNDPVEEITYPCENCGHTMVAHGGPHNPGLQECLVCWLVMWPNVESVKHDPLTEAQKAKIRTMRVDVPQPRHGLLPPHKPWP